MIPEGKVQLKRTHLLPAAAAALMVVLAACGGGGSESGGHDHGAAKATCSPSGPSLKIVAKSVKFDKTCLAGPANQELSLTLDNRDAGVPHNLAVFRDAGMSERLFTGETFSGEKQQDYKIPPLPAGDYHFHCDVHPNTMEGIFKVA